MPTCDSAVAVMHLRLELLKRCQFFWLRAIKKVDISQCCAKCFIGEKDNRVYYGTLNRGPGTVVELDVQQYPTAKAYYLCGLSAGFRWILNTHIAFVPDSESTVEVESDRVKVLITNARRINFWDYVPDPPGVFTQAQRTCRNWIFANYLKDGRPL